MEESGPRHPPATNPLIIERPDLQSRRQKFLSNVLTVFFWGLWVVLWLPVATFLGWVFFSLRFHQHMIVLAGYAGFLKLLWVYALVILLLGGGLLVWAKYNHLRFRGVERRRDFPLVTRDDLARLTGFSAADIERWQQLRILTVEHDQKGHIAQVLDHDATVPEAAGHA